MKRDYGVTSILIITILLGGVLLGLAPSTVLGSGSKIQHLIFIAQQNHSVDNYFGTYPSVDGLSFSLLKVALGAELELQLTFLARFQ
jgi:phospholipase C